MRGLSVDFPAWSSLEEVVVVVLAEEVLVVLPWLDEHVCRCWVVPGGGQASLQASLHESVAKCNYVK